jgi:hypothetical protein
VTASPPSEAGGRQKNRIWPEEHEGQIVVIGAVGAVAILVWGQEKKRQQLGAGRVSFL